MTCDLLSDAATDGCFPSPYVRPLGVLCPPIGMDSFKPLTSYHSAVPTGGISPDIGGAKASERGIPCANVRSSAETVAAAPPEDRENTRPDGESRL